VDKQHQYFPPLDCGLALIHQDASLLVVDKPAGLLAVPGRGEDKQDSLATRLQRQFPEALVVHRLDMATSGLMLFARNAEVQRRMSRAFAERRVEKRYLAVVAGQMETSGEIDLPILADWLNRPLRKIDAEQGKPSLTRYTLLKYDSILDISRIELEPVTGRTHQLRVHLQAIGHSILGDTLYQGRAAARLLLHASRLNFEHPITGSALHFLSEAPF
jgi:tRNA pseudouridine32 synthase/23S rRNA pseudouridine746 synthase